MTEIQQNRWDQLVRRIANIVGGGSQVNDTLNELFPVINVETRNTELLILSKWRTALGSTTFAALAGNFDLIQLFNPVDSGMFIVPTRVDFSVSLAGGVRYGVASNALADNTANVQFRDTRTGITDLPVGQVRSVQQAGGFAQFSNYVVLALTTATIQNDRGLFTLAPGTGLTFATSGQNRTLDVSFFWKERVAEPAELNF